MNMTPMKYFLMALSFFLIFSCEEKKPGLVKQVEKPKQEKPAWKPKFYGNSEVPANDSIITSAGMGRVVLGQKLDKIDELYDSIQSFSQSIDFLEWPAKKIILGKNEWIIASTANSVGTINMVRTNSRMLRTKNGCLVGMPVSVIVQKDSLAIDDEEKAFVIYPERIEFRIEEGQQKNFFRSGNPDVRKLNPKAMIREIFIKCGDC
jgi:hypothetical protein